MKFKTLICSIGLFSMAIAASAQTSFGVVAGVNINKIRLEEESLDPKAGFHLGVLMETQVVGNLYLQPSLLFTQKGSVAKEGSAELTYKLNYLELPVEVSYRMPLGPASLDIIAGPYFAMGLKGKCEAEAAGISLESDNIFGDDGEFKRFDAGLRCGVGTHLLKHLGVTLYYDLGFVNMTKDDIEDAVKAKNGTFMISASFTF